MEPNNLASPVAVVSMSLVATIVILACTHRYEIVVVPGVTGPIAQSPSYSYRLDRWTGEVQMLVGSNGFPVEVKQAPQPAISDKDVIWDKPPAAAESKPQQ